MRPTRFHASTMAALVTVAVVGLVGCGSANVVDLQFGGITVDTLTEGSNLDPNAYNLAVNGPGLDVQQTIGLNDRVVFSVSPGAYTVRLSDLAANCVVDVNPRNVTVAGGSTIAVVFRVVCA